MKIFLVGFMGSGKSTIGRKLALYLQYHFIDLDKLIENKAGMSISEYFSEYGEDRFREFESAVLQQTVFPENVIIATGGGTPCYFNNMAWMNDEGKTVYLHMEPKALAQRLKYSKSERPLIRDLSSDELVGFITQKLADRDVFYRKSQLIISGLDLTAQKLAGYLALPSSDR